MFPPNESQTRERGRGKGGRREGNYILRSDSLLGERSTSEGTSSSSSSRSEIVSLPRRLSPSSTLAARGEAVHLAGRENKQTQSATMAFCFPSKSPPGNPQLEEIERARLSNYRQCRSERRVSTSTSSTCNTRDARHIYSPFTPPPLPLPLTTPSNTRLNPASLVIRIS